LINLNTVGEVFHPNADSLGQVTKNSPIEGSADTPYSHPMRVRTLVIPFLGKVLKNHDCYIFVNLEATGAHRITTVRTFNSTQTLKVATLHAIAIRSKTKNRND
uniref:Kinesin motor domain-containing protein n=1 Tax=Haemonchus placei TaxID=6290 RepID=A0A0N4W6V8_HAEPC